MTRLLKRLRRRGRRVSPTWRIVYYHETEITEVVEVIRTYRPTRKARALMRDGWTHFEIEQVA